MGEVLIGIPVVENKYTTFSVKKDTKSVTETTECVYGQLLQLQRKLLDNYESLKIVHAYTEMEIKERMAIEQIEHILKTCNLPSLRAAALKK